MKNIFITLVLTFIHLYAILFHTQYILKSYNLFNRLLLSKMGYFDSFFKMPTFKTIAKTFQAIYDRTYIIEPTFFKFKFLKKNQ